MSEELDHPPQEIQVRDCKEKTAYRKPVRREPPGDEHTAPSDAMRSTVLRRVVEPPVPFLRWVVGNE